LNPGRRWIGQAAARGDPDAVAMVADVWAELNAEERELARQVLLPADPP